MGAAQILEAITESERAAVEQIRYEVYTAEMGLYVEDADNERKRLSDAHDEGSVLLLGTVDGKAVGTVRIHTGPFPRAWSEELDLAVFGGDVAPTRMAFGSRLTVLPEHRGTDVVLGLIAGCCRAALRAGCDLLLLDCVPHLVALYEGLGWRRYTGKTVEDPHTGVLIPMALALHDREHLRRCRSPLLALIDEIAPDVQFDPALQRHLSRDDLAVRPSSPLWPIHYRTLADGLLRGLSEEDAAALLDKSQILDLRPWQTFVRQGTVYRTLFVVLGGCVEISKDGAPVCELHEGEVLGEISWLLQIERTADVCAGARGARVLALHEGTIKSLMRRRPAAGVALMGNLACTLAARLSSATWSAPLARGAL